MADETRKPNIVKAVISDYAFTISVWALGLAGLTAPLGILGYLFVNGISVIEWDFLTQGPGGLPLGAAGGIGPAIQGSVALVGIGTAFAFPMGVGGAIYLAEYGNPGPILRSFRFAAECLAGIPAIVYGLFGYAFLVVFMSFRISLLAGGITLGFLMFPVILIGSHEAIKAVENEYREASLSLGVTRSYMVRRIILKKAWAGILGVTTLAIGHAIGSASPVLYTASVIFTHGELSLSAPVMTLPTHLYYLVGEAVSFEHAYGTAFVMLIVVLLSNIAGLALKKLGARN